MSSRAHVSFAGHAGDPGDLGAVLVIHVSHPRNHAADAAPALLTTLFAYPPLTEILPLNRRRT
jgi:hypothetical protein